MIRAVLSMRSLEARRVNTGHAAVDEPLVLRYELSNRSRLPVFGVMIDELGTAQRGQPRQGPIARGWLVHLGGRERGTASGVAWPRHRGVLELDTIALSSAFPFGVLRKTLRLSQPERVPVFPKLRPLPEGTLTRLLARAGQGERRRDRPGIGDEFFGLRDYRPNDPRRSIHWRRSAQAGRLVVRETAQAAPTRLRLWLDLESTRSAALDLDPRRDSEALAALEAEEERAISLAASALCEGHLAGFELGLRVTGVTRDSDAAADAPRHFELLPERSAVHRTRLLDALAGFPRLTIEPDGPDRSAAAAAVRRDAGDDGRTTLVVRPGRGPSRNPRGDGAGGRGRRVPVMYADAADAEPVLAGGSTLDGGAVQAGGPAQATEPDTRGAA